MRGIEEDLRLAGLDLARVVGHAHAPDVAALVTPAQGPFRADDLRVGGSQLVEPGHPLVEGGVGAVVGAVAVALGVVGFEVVLQHLDAGAAAQPLAHLVARHDDVGEAAGAAGDHVPLGLAGGEYVLVGLGLEPEADEGMVGRLVGGHGRQGQGGQDEGEQERALG